MSVPTRMRALLLTNFVTDFDTDDLDKHLKVEEVDVPQPQYGQVLVRVECSPINPSDLSTITGTYNSKQRQPLPCQLGYEASGVVVQSGGGLMAYYLIGKRVAIVSSRGGIMWSEYAIVPAMQCIVLPNEISFELGCSCFANPLTAISFVEIAQQRGLKTILHTAAASSLGKMLVRYAAQYDIKIICVVRKESQEKILRELGAETIVNTSTEGWEAVLQEACIAHDVRLGFDAVAGELTGAILKAMPPNSELMVYGGLSLEHCSGIRPTDLIFQNKKVSGFWIPQYFKTKSTYQLYRITQVVVNNLRTSLGTPIRVKYPIEKAVDAIRDYRANMNDDKVAFAPQMRPES
eukprot:c45800_g1_i1.p1 GENE.c45800_g1_i1~~c45800_g1_i1.p1  ORF type:complete len:359 (+),score=77.43 c45800_g1_i1:32-1078(+)